MSIYRNIIIPVYANATENSQKGRYLKQVFHNKPEFELTLLETEYSDYWETFRHCAQLGNDQDEDLLIICNESHQFTEEYNRDLLIQNIVEAHQQKCDILFGGIGGFGYAVPLTENRYWIDRVRYCHFFVIFRKAFNLLINSPFKKDKPFDDYLSALTMHKMVLSPFLSVQRKILNSQGDEEAISKELRKSFEIAGSRLSTYKNVYNKYIK